MKPYERYREVFIDEGMNNMFAVMKELVKNKYTHLIYPEHPRRLDYDAERGRDRRLPRRRRLRGIRVQRRLRAGDAAGGDVLAQYGRLERPGLQARQIQQMPGFKALGVDDPIEWPGRIGGNVLFHFRIAFAHRDRG